MRTEYAMSVLYASVAGFRMEVFKTLPNTEENSTLLTKVLSLSVFLFPCSRIFLLRAYSTFPSLRVFVHKVLAN